MKLELKHLAPYLPYGLKMKGNISENIWTLSALRELGIRMTETGRSTHGIEYWEDYFDFKPILHPLSDLTKEIEHNGEKFVPVIKLLEDVFNLHWGDEYYRYYEPDITVGIAVKNKPTGNIIFCIDYKNMDSCRFDIMQKLFEWHFNVFDLPKDLWVDINKLKQKT